MELVVASETSPRGLSHDLRSIVGPIVVMLAHGTDCIVGNVDSFHQIRGLVDLFIRRRNGNVFKDHIGRLFECANQRMNPPIVG